MTTTQTFKSTDTGAPSLAGQTGLLIALLDAVLINGYNSQTLTSITRSGATATATKTAHGFRNGAHVAHSGADQAEYNGKFKITVVDANTYTFTVSGAPATPATGTITAKVAPVGWTKEFSGTNKAVYRPSQGNRFYLRVLDDGSDGTNGARVAMIRGYETMSDVDTGTGPFPTAAQAASGIFVGKSSTADATSRSWVVQADEKRVILHIAPLATAATAHGQNGFGDLVRPSAADAYASFIHGSDTSANAVVTPGNIVGRATVTCTVGPGPLYTPRAASGTGTAVAPYYSMCGPATSSGSGVNTFAVPLTNGDIRVEPIYVADGTTNSGMPRGYYPGVMYCRNYLDTSYVNGTVYGQYEVLRTNTTGSYCYLIDTGDWE